MTPSLAGCWLPKLCCFYSGLQGKFDIAGRAAPDFTSVSYYLPPGQKTACPADELAEISVSTIFTIFYSHEPVQPVSYSREESPYNLAKPPAFARSESFVQHRCAYTGITNLKRTTKNKIKIEHSCIHKSLSAEHLLSRF